MTLYNLFDTIESMYDHVFDFLYEKYGQTNKANVRKQKVSIGVIFYPDDEADEISIDGGNTWTESAFPLQNSSTTLVDMNMADENTAVVSVMKRGTDAYPTIYLTTDGGTSWEVTEISFAGLGIEIQYLGDIIDFTSENGVFSITFGQENDGTRTATYESSDNGKSWTLSGTGKATVHTVG